MSCAESIVDKDVSVGCELHNAALSVYRGHTVDPATVLQMAPDNSSLYRSKADNCGREQAS